MGRDGHASLSFPGHDETSGRGDVRRREALLTAAAVGTVPFAYAHIRIYRTAEKAVRRRGHACALELAAPFGSDQPRPGIFSAAFDSHR